jgi:uncharacterized protein
MRLSPPCARVLGSLVEKALTTPLQYPLTLNSLVAACNQTSNREPVVNYDEATVDTALYELKDAKLVRFVLPSHGRSVVRYRHVLDEALGLDDGQSAILAMLLLRGAQTAGELRARTERMAPFDGLRGVEHDLELLASREDPLAASVGRRPGQKEERWASPWLDPTGDDPSAADHDSAPASFTDTSRPDTSRPGTSRPDTAPAPSPPVSVPASSLTQSRDGLRTEVDELRAEVTGLRSDIALLRAELEELRASLGG